MPPINPLEAAVALGLLGAITGSFIATLVVRWPAGRSVAAGRSACDGCGKPLGVAELVPLLSFALQRGRCRACRAPIARFHPAIELAAAAIGASAGWVAPGWEGLAGATFGWLLLALGALDLAAFWLPDTLTLPLGLVAHGYRRVRGRAGLGGGDPKLFGAIGLWLGWSMLPGVLLAASLAGLGYVGWRALVRRPVARSDALPLGALLALAAYPAWLLMVASRP